MTFLSISQYLSSNVNTRRLYTPYHSDCCTDDLLNKKYLQYLFFLFVLGSSTNSTMSSTATSINFGPSIESNDGLSVSESHKDANSISRYGSYGGSTTSLASCPEWKTIKDRSRSESGIEKDVSSVSLDSGCSKSRRDKSVSRINEDWSLYIQI